MQTRLNAVLAAVVAALAVVAVGLAATRAYGGPLDPPGPVGSTRPVVEPRTPLTQPASAAEFPIVISQPGSYYLTSNITGVAGKHGISVTSSGVTIDLNGFQLVGVAGSLAAINVPNFIDGLRVQDGVVRLWGAGIEASVARGGSFENLQLISNSSSGLSVASSSRVYRVEARGHTGQGVLFVNVGSGGSLEDSILNGNGYGVGLNGNGVLVRESVFALNTVAGVDIGGTSNRIDENYFRGNGKGIRLLGNSKRGGAEPRDSDRAHGVRELGYRQPHRLQRGSRSRHLVEQRRLFEHSLRSVGRGPFLQLLEGHRRRQRTNVARAARDSTPRIAICCRRACRGGRTYPSRQSRG